MKRIFATSGNYGTVFAASFTLLYAMFGYNFFVHSSSTSSKFGLSVQQACTAIKARKFQFIVDVRMIDEWKSGHLADSIHIPLHNFERTIEKTIPKKDASMLLICRSGRRAAQATEEALALGYTSVNYVSNGGVYEVQQCLK